jgi:two-component system NtrC family sensor kinase
MSLEKESLLENLNLIYRLKEQAESLRKESDILLHGMRDILEASSRDELYDKMFGMFGKIIPNCDCFILVPSELDQLICMHTTDIRFAETVWQMDPVLESVMQGKPSAIFNIGIQPAWQHQDIFHNDIKSVMYCPLKEEGHTSIMVFCATEIGFYTQEHVSIATRYRDFIEQTILSVKAKLEALATERLREEKALVERSMFQSERMASLGLLAAGVAHEINNPIGFVKSNVEYLTSYAPKLKGFFTELHRILKGHDSAAHKLELIENLFPYFQCDELIEEYDELCEEMVDGVARVKDIVDSLQSFVRQGDDNDALFVDITRCIKDSLRVVNSKFQNIDVILNLTNELLAKGSAGPFNQVLVNLFVNASHAMSGKGEMTITTSSLDDEVCISISDSGCGMSEESAARIFEPFYTTKPQGEGTGLGLYISYSLIESFGGRIEVDTEEGVGTTFYIWLKQVK